MNSDKFWSPKRVAALEGPEVRNLRANAVQRGQHAIAALCDQRLALGREAMLRKYEVAASAWPRRKSSVPVTTVRKLSPSPRPARPSIAVAERATGAHHPMRAAPSKKESQRRLPEPKLLKVELESKALAQWNTKLGSGGSVSGFEYRYVVIDGNYSSRNKWVAIVQVPKDGGRHEGIVIRLDRESCPDRVSVNKHGIWRKSIVFMATTIGSHLDKHYAKVFEVERGRGKSILKRGERSMMFDWLQCSYFVSCMRLKGTVTTSNASDLEHQVLLAKPTDHQRMIRTFFALRVWDLL